MSKTPSIHLPVFQRFDCGGCTHCCRLVANVSADDRRRIIDAGWEERMGGEPMFVEYRLGRRKRYRLAQRSDGACVFLDTYKRCRLHAETGPDTKPLACRMFPYVVVPGVEGPRLDLRMDCPSVAANQGRTLSTHSSEIRRLAAESGMTTGLPQPPEWAGQRDLNAAEFRALVEGFDWILSKTGEPLRVRLQAGCTLLDCLHSVRIRKVRDDGFVEMMDILKRGALMEAADVEQVRTLARKVVRDGIIDSDWQETLGQPPLGRRPGRLFRQWLFLHTVSESADTLSLGRLTRLRHSWLRHGQARRFAAGTGPVPQIRPEWPDTTFEAVKQVPRASESALEPVCRSLRLKLEAHAFAGPAYFGYDLLTGLTALWLTPALVGWMARMAALRRGSRVLESEDVLDGLRQTHLTFGASPVFARLSERLRLRGLARPGVPAAILRTYGP